MKKQNVPFLMIVCCIALFPSLGGMLEGFTDRNIYGIAYQWWFYCSAASLIAEILALVVGILFFYPDDPLPASPDISQEIDDPEAMTYI